MVSPRYLSTRSTETQSTGTQSTGTRVTFEQALLSGLAPDGGLYLPDAIPPLAPEVWRRATSFTNLASDVLWRWLEDDIPHDTLARLLADAYPFPIPCVALADDLFVLELFHGPTLSFKDFGARTMARLMNHFLARRSERLTILVATSGDTGSAVADGFAAQANIDVVLLYPKGKVSLVQEQQLIVRREGVRAFALEGSFDDCQRLVKAAFQDEALAGLNLSSANSINIGRLLPQSLYYLWAVTRTQQEPINFCVPSGNLGNLTGGTLAYLAGLPVGRFVAAHNANDYFPRYLNHKTGAFAFEPTVATLSNAMDVGAPSNFERLAKLVSPELLAQRFWGVSVSDETTRERMRRTHQETGYVACPHTAVGLAAINRYRLETGDYTPAVVLATAHPAKFPEVVEAALGVPPHKVERLEALFEQPTEVQDLAPSLEALRGALLSS